MCNAIDLQRIPNHYASYKDKKNGDCTSMPKCEPVLVTMSLPKLFNETWAMFEWNIGYGGLEVET